MYIQLLRAKDLFYVELIAHYWNHYRDSLYAAGFRKVAMLEICDVDFRRIFLTIDSAGPSLCTYVH
jgi:hypothetical protein